MDLFNTGVLREEGVLDGERFILISNSLVHPSFPGTVSNASNINNHSCLHPFEFPVASMGMFTNERPRKERGASAIFKRFVCRKVDRNGDKFVTYWTPTTDTVMVVNRITFHDDTIPVFEWFANDTKSTFEKFDYTSGKRRILASHRTKWVDFNGIKVPSEVTMYLNHGSDNRQGYNIDVQIEYFDKTSKKYSEFQKRIGNSKKLVAAERIKANELSGAQ